MNKSSEDLFTIRFGSGRRAQAGSAAPEPRTIAAYLRLGKGQQVSVPRIDFGRNYAGQASFTYSAKHNGRLERLTDGVFEARRQRGRRGYRCRTLAVRSARNDCTAAERVPARLGYIRFNGLLRQLLSLPYSRGRFILFVLTQQSLR